MNHPQPILTVLMPAYNAGKYIAKAIDSVLEQTFPDFELLIINDGSTDQTINIINNYKDPRIRVISQPNAGIAAALNKGIKASYGRYIARFDADDICYPGRLDAQFCFITKNPGYIIVGSDADYIDMHDEFVFAYRSPAYSDEAIRALQNNTCAFIHSSVFFDKEAIIKTGGYNIHAHTFEDHLLWSKVLQQGKACNLPQKLLKVRLNPDSITIDEKWRQKEFLTIKYRALEKGNISEAEGNRLTDILKAQENNKIKEGAYYVLLGKKYLWDNYQPGKARINLKKTLPIRPFDMNTYGLLLLSYLPAGLIQKIYNWLGPGKQ